MRCKMGDTGSAMKKSSSAKRPSAMRTKRVRKPQLDENGEEKKCFICGATKCRKCGKVINLSQGGYPHGPDGYTCEDCFEW